MSDTPIGFTSESHDCPVSVALVCYNHVQYVSKAIDSILSQTLPAREIVIVDDGSTDGSEKILDEYAAKHSNIRLIRHEKNLGVRIARNHSLEHVTQEYVVLMASDDILLPRHLEISFAYLKSFSNAGFSCSMTLAMDPEDRCLGIAYFPIPARRPCYLTPEESLRFLTRYGDWFAMNTALWKTKLLLEEYEKVSKILDVRRDIFVAHALSLKQGHVYIPEPLGAWRIMSQGISAQSFLEETFRDNMEKFILALQEHCPDITEEYIKTFKNKTQYYKEMLRIHPGDSIYSRIAYELRRVRTALKFGILTPWQIYQKLLISKKNAYYKRRYSEPMSYYLTHNDYVK